jgi:hypothetical protein
MKNSKWILTGAIVIVVMLTWSGCKRMRYTGFSVNEVIIQSGLENITVGNNYFLKFEGKEINDETDRVTIYPGFTSASFYPNFSAEKEQKDYKITLMREEASGEYEVYSFNIKFIDHAGQESFTIAPGDGFKFQFKMSWPAWW